MNSVSIIVTLEEEQQQLRQLLPALLTMHYDGEYEVIVVDKKHDKDIAEWLGDMETRYTNLCHTFCSATARGIDIHRLALTLGAKAASYEWVAILPVGFEAGADGWLGQLETMRDEGADVVIGITDRRRRLNWLTSYVRRHRFSLFRPTSSVILCRRHSLLGNAAVKPSECKIIKL